MSDVLSIQHKEGKMRQRPSFLSKINLTLPYGTKVTKLKEQGDWFHVSHYHSKGWLHKSSLTTKEIILKAGNADVKRAANDDELVLAGKGFSREVENNYRRRNPAMSFADVDKMENLNIDALTLHKFIQQGELKNG